MLNVDKVCELIVGTNKKLTDITNYILDLEKQKKECEDQQLLDKLNKDHGEAILVQTKLIGYKEALYDIIQAK
jgi:hypothetical protein